MCRADERSLSNWELRVNVDGILKPFTQLRVRFMCWSAWVIALSIYTLFCVRVGSDKRCGITCSPINLICLVSRLVVLIYYYNVDY